MDLMTEIKVRQFKLATLTLHLPTGDRSYVFTKSQLRFFAKGHGQTIHEKRHFHIRFPCGCVQYWDNYRGTSEHQCDAHKQ